MSSILFDEPPLTVGRKLARILGLNKAIVIQQIHYWLQKNERNNRNYHDEYYWTYNSISRWHQENFDFWCERTVKRVFSELEKEGLLISGNYNKLRYDRTKWYRINYDKLTEIFQLVSPRKGQIVQPSDKKSQRKGQNVTNNTKDFTENEPETTTELGTTSPSSQDPRDTNISWTSRNGGKKGKKKEKRELPNFGLARFTYETGSKLADVRFRALRDQLQESLKEAESSILLAAKSDPDLGRFYEVQGIMLKEMSSSLAGQMRKVLTDWNKKARDAMELLGGADVDVKQYTEWFVEKFKEIRAGGRSFGFSWGLFVSSNMLTEFSSNYVDKQTEADAWAALEKDFEV